jgi:hypothetical protein
LVDDYNECDELNADDASKYYFGGIELTLSGNEWFVVFHSVVSGKWKGTTAGSKKGDVESPLDGSVRGWLGWHRTEALLFVCANDWDELDGLSNFERW